MARSDARDTYTRTNNRKRPGFSRKGTGVKSQTLYPTNPAARRRLNSKVNEAWVNAKDEG